MANTLTGLIPTLYQSLEVISRELVGFIPAVSRDSTAERAALNQTVRSPVANVGAAGNISPGQQPANDGSATMGYVDVTITKSRYVPILWTGEEQLSVSQNGVYNELLAQQFVLAMRTLCNEIESDIGVAAKNGSSRAYGSAGTNPFNTANDLSDFAALRQILEENGAPQTDLQLVLGSGAWFNLRSKQAMLLKVNEAGSSDMLRDGITQRVEGFALRNSAGVALHTKGSGTGYVTNSGTSSAIGDTVIPVDTGSGTIIAGDVLTFADESPAHKYVVNGALSGGNVTLGAPGLRNVVPDGKAVTVGANYRAHMAFDRRAIVLATRAPARPLGGDSADDAMTITDPFSGLTFEVSIYRMYRQVKYEVAIAWGTKAVKSPHIATLIG